MRKEIPIRNLYYLLSYAWDCLDKGREAVLGQDNFTNSANLMARLMDLCLQSVQRRGFHKEYSSCVEEISGVRGRICLSSTLKSGSLVHGKSICEFDEHGFDSPLNRALKGALRVLIASPTLDAGNLRSLKRYIGLLEAVADVPLSEDILDSIKINSHNRHYRFAIELCRLVARNLVVSSDAGIIQLSNFLDESFREDRIFEKFVRNFYSYHLKGAEVSSPIFQWQVETNDECFAERVPELRTDVVITRGGIRLILDAKFYREALTSSFAGGKFKFRRSHLSQIMEYMRTSHRRLAVPTRGMLLYPTVQEDFENAGRIEGHEVRVATIDLSAPWESIERKLMTLADSCLAPQSAA